MGFRTHIVKNVIYPIYESVSGRRILSKLSDLEKTQWFTRNEIRDLQWRKLVKLLNHVYRNVPYYTKVFNERGLKPEHIKDFRDLLRLPILTKKVIRENLSDLVARNIRSDNLKQNSTGGSTGQNIIFYNDKKCLDYRSATTIRNQRWAGFDIGDKHALIWGAPMDISKQRKLKQKVRNYLFGTIFLSSCGIEETDLQAFWERLNRFKPKVLVSYPTPLCFFAHFLNTHALSPPDSLKSIITSAETLFSHQREMIEKTFKIPVYNRYGTREVGTIAQQCSECQGLHINSERVYLEFIRNNEHVIPGELGEIIVTDLDNYGMPFIRYAIGDIAIPTDKNCTCGRGLPIIENIEGRTFDIIVSPSGKLLAGTFW